MGEIVTRHHDKSQTVRLDSGRKIRIPASVVEVLAQTTGVGQVFVIYAQKEAGFLIGGNGEMAEQWLKCWTEKGIEGTFKPYVSAVELAELLMLFSPRWRSLNLDLSRDLSGTCFERCAHLNVRATRPFIEFRCKAEGGYQWGFGPLRAEGNVNV